MQYAIKKKTKKSFDQKRINHEIHSMMSKSLLEVNINYKHFFLIIDIFSLSIYYYICRDT
jgi:hypothetical protein